jgi:hypothetical protein
MVLADPEILGKTVVRRNIVDGRMGTRSGSLAQRRLELPCVRTASLPEALNSSFPRFQFASLVLSPQPRDSLSGRNRRNVGLPVSPRAAYNYEYSDTISVW